MIKFAKITILLIVFSFAFTQAISQEIDENYETLLLEEEPTVSGIAFKPIIAIGVGSFSFFGDVTDYFRSPFNGLTSYRVAISRNIGNFFDIEFNGTFGDVAGNSFDGNPLNAPNFKSNLFMGGVSIFYNFNHIFKRKRPIHPYISAGVEIIQFNPKGDFLDKNGKQYHYWKDGTIRDMEEKLGANGKILTRDYKYESNLRKLDLYGYGDYSLTTVAFPIDAGLNITISDRVTARFGAALHIPLTDYIDNVKKGGNDLILNTYVSLSFDMFSAADEIAAVSTFKNLKFTITDNKDSDGDGVDDFNDECPDTPKGVKVDFRGCPEDTDKDGVPDYLDKQNTVSTSGRKVIVNSRGIQLKEAQLITLLYDPTSVKRSEVKLYKKKTKVNSSVKGKMPEKFKIVDLNKDNYISLEELNKAIDAIFEMKSTLTPDDIYELQEYFFNQE